MKLDYEQRQRAQQVLEWIIDGHEEEAAFEIIGLRDQLKTASETSLPNIDTQRQTERCKIIWKWMRAAEVGNVSRDTAADRCSNELEAIDKAMALPSPEPVDSDSPV